MKKILIVDDSTTIRNIIKTVLYDDYLLFEADNGQNAFDVAMKESIDLFLLDVNMPVMNGLELLKLLREQVQYEKTPVIMLTTESREHKKEEGKALKANGWIVKPCDPGKLLNVIKRLI